MNDSLNEISVFSPFKGQLILEEVPGINHMNIPENSVNTIKGLDRTMYVYAPESGNYDAKQTQVMMVLRDDDSFESAELLMKELRLDKLAEEKHFVLLFPNPIAKSWNYTEDINQDDDLGYFVRCFASLPKSKGKVAGFNGMIFYLATTEATSAIVSLLAEKQPIDCTAMMLGKYPADYHNVKNGLRQPINAWVYETNKELQEYLIAVNQVGKKVVLDGCNKYTSKINKNNYHFVSEKGLNTESIVNAWDLLFSESRRWRNDTHGTYQKRTNFSQWGFVSHVNDDSLGVNNGFKHTWYEYVPEHLKNTGRKVPLLFYFHGGNCVPLYGAEQSDWHRIAKKENFIVVYPKASFGKAWNVFNDSQQPSDFDFVMALIKHMKKSYLIDETRIYISGFSMGSMMTNALACVYPNVFAAAAPCNAQHLGYLSNSAKLKLTMNPQAVFSDDILNEVSNTKLLADEIKKKKDYRMPVFQCSGLLDGLSNTSWPIKDKDSLWISTINYWKDYNHIPITEFAYNGECETGLYADETKYECADERFIHHIWYSVDTKLPLYHFLVAKRMPHAVDLREIELAWQFIKHYSRSADGTLIYKD